MPDISSPSGATAPQTNDAPPSEDGWRPDLNALRARLDEIDDKIHDLLIDRARVVEGVARSGKPAAFRPGREAAILRRLLGRHTGQLPPRTLVRMWREMLAGTTAMQAPIVVAVYDPTGAIGLTAREHFGFLTSVVPHPTIDGALEAVRTNRAAVAVLPFPSAESAWWAELNRTEPHLHVIARLPFWADRPDHVPSADALAVATSAPDPSGHDRSFRARADGTIAEVEGLISDDDPRLPPNARALGGYAVPVAGDKA